MPNTHSLDLESGSSQFASATDSASLSPTGDITIGSWIRFETLQDCQFVSKFLDTGNVRSYRFGFNEAATDELTFAYSTDGTFQAANAVAVNWDAPALSTWFHVAVTLDVSASEVKFYVDTVQQGATQTGTGTSINDGTSAFYVGALNFSGGDTQFLDGMIDEVQFYNAIKTIGDIWKHDVSNEANIQGYWQLNNGYSDSSGNSNTLTASGSPVFSSTVPFANYISPANFLALL